MEKKKAWRYHMIWHTRAHKEILNEEIRNYIIRQLNQLCLEIKVQLVKVNLKSEAIELEIATETSINSVKTLKTIQKKLAKSLLKKFDTLKSVGMELWDPLYTLTTQTQTGGECDMRVEKILESLWSVELYDLDEGLSEEMEPFKEYLAKRKLGIIDYGEAVFLVDEEAINKKINLNCFECTKIYKYGCCAGSPCNLSRKNEKLFRKHLSKIEDRMKAVDKAYYDKIHQEGLLAFDGTIKEYEGRCALLVEEDGCYKCMAHKYALEEKLPVYDLCPLSCLMYPLEIMELITDKQKKVILITSVVEEFFAKEFGRWGSYECLDVDLRCIYPDKHDELFKKEDYKPVYEVNKNLLIHEFGEEVYKGIKQLLQE